MRDILSLKERKKSEKTKSAEGGKHFFVSEERTNKLSKNYVCFFSLDNGLKKLNYNMSRKFAL